jgi:hypothetical protein
MNLIEISEQLKDVPDQLLMKEVQSPSGAYPSYLVVTEMTRRKRMRDQAMKEAPSTTVVQDLTQPSRDQMMAAMAATQRGMAPSSQLVSPEAPPPQAQQMSQPAPRLNAPGIMASQQAMNTLAAQDVMGAQEPRRMAGGGMVAFAEGGMPQYDDRGVARFQNTGEVREYGFGPYKAFPGLDRFFSSTPLGSEYETPAQTRARLRKEAEQRAEGGQSFPTQVIAAAADSSSAPPVPVTSGPNYVAPGASNKSSATRNVGAADQTKDARQSNAGRTPTFNFSQISPLSLTPYVDPYEAEVKANAAAFRATREPTPQEIETERAAREIRYGEKVPFRMGFLEKEIGKREKDIEGRRSSNINEALIQTGLGVMRSKSPRFLGALGEGGTEGLAAYRQGLKDIREGEKDILQSKVSLANSQTLYDQGKFVDSEKAEDKAYQRYERGISRLSTENAMLARAQTQSIQAAQLAQQGEVAKNTAAINQRKLEMEQFKLPYELQESQARTALYGDQGAYYRSGGGRSGQGGLGRLTDADQKAAEDFANAEIFKRLPKGTKPDSQAYKVLWDQLYMEALTRRAQGLDYKPGQVNPSGAVLQKGPDGSLNYVPPK